MPSALSILWTLTSLLSLWGLSLIYRGLRANRNARHSLTCPSCRKPCSELSCSHCGYEGQSPRDFRHPRNWRLTLSGLLPLTAAAISAFLAEVVRSWFSFNDSNPADSFSPFQAASLGIFIFALIVAIWSYRGDRSRGRRRCPKCWYDMSGSQLICPECGHDAKVVKNLYRPRRRKRGILIGLCISLAAYGVWIIPRIHAGGPVAAIPTWVLIAGLPWFPDSFILESSSGSADEDWTLGGRHAEEHLWQIESWLLHKRARFVVATSPRIWSLVRAAPFLGRADADLAIPAQLSILRALASPDLQLRARATIAMEQVPFFLFKPMTAEQLLPFLPGLIAALDDPSRDTRSYAAAYISDIGEPASHIVPALFDKTASAGRIEIGYWHALLKLAQVSKSARDQVLFRSQDSDPLIRRACCYALSSPESAADGGTYRLLELLHDPDPEVEFSAAATLCRTSKEDSTMVPIILDWIEHPDAGVSQVPASLYQFGALLNPHMHRIAALLRSPDPDLQNSLLWILSYLARDKDIQLAPVLIPLYELTASPNTQNAELSRSIIELMAKRIHPPGPERDYWPHD